jgi:hypothetical protein
MREAKLILFQCFSFQYFGFSNDRLPPLAVLQLFCKTVPASDPAGNHPVATGYVSAPRHRLWLL